MTVEVFPAATNNSERMIDSKPLLNIQVSTTIVIKVYPGYFYL